MSTICGIFSFEDEKIFKADIFTILKSLTSNESGNCSIWIKNNLGLGQQNFDTNPKTSPNFPELENSENRLTIVADAFLTNREDLIQILNITGSDQIHISDRQLIVKAYEKWGEDCSKYLIGDFAFAIWDQLKKKLFCSRDHFGRCLFFYFKDSKRFIFASQPKGIVGLKYVPTELNKNKLADLIRPSSDNPFAHESWFKNIFSLPAGTNLIVDSDGIRLNKYWEPKIGEKLPYKNEREILEAFRELMFQVIGAYLRSDSPVSALLSGGLDSSAIVGVAAQILEKQNKQLDVFSSVLPDENDRVLEDERSFIQQFQSFSNINFNYISAEKKGPFSDLAEVFENRDSPEVTSRHYLFTEFRKAANQLGSRKILVGVLGELGPTFDGAGGYAELFSKFRWPTLWRELNLRKNIYGESLRYNIRAKVINPFIPDTVLRIKHRKFSNKLLPDKFHFFQEDFANDLIRQVSPNIRRSEDILFRTAPDHRINQLNNILWMQTRASARSVKYNAKYPAEIKFPLLDKRMLEFCLAVPLNLKIRDGYDRYLIRKGLDGILPPKIQWRNSKKPFSPDYIRRYNKQRKEVGQFLAEIESNDPIRQIVNVKKLREWLRSEVEENDDFAESISRDLFPQAIYLIYFLRKFPEFRH